MAEQLSPASQVVWFAVGRDFVNNKVVLVMLRHDETVWWQELSLPTSSYLSWSAPQQVTLPSGANPNLVVGNLWLVSSGQQRLVCFGLTYNEKVFAFRIGDTTAELINLPSNVVVGREIGASEVVAGGTANEILVVGEDINDVNRLYRAKLRTNQWPPVIDSNGWEDWGGTSSNRPAFAYGPTTMTAFKMSGTTLYRCWCYQSDLNWGSWWSLGSVSGSASHIHPQPMAWHSTPTTPQADAVFVRQVDGTLLYAYESGSDSTSWYSLSRVPNITSSATPALVPYNNTTPLMVKHNGNIMYSRYWLKENHFTALQTATSVQDIKSFTGLVIPIEDSSPAGEETDYLVGFYHRDDGIGIWIDGVPLGY